MGFQTRISLAAIKYNLTLVVFGVTLNEALQMQNIESYFLVCISISRVASFHATITTKRDSVFSHKNMPRQFSFNLFPFLPC